MVKKCVIFYLEQYSCVFVYLTMSKSQDIMQPIYNGLPVNLSHHDELRVDRFKIVVCDELTVLVVDRIEYMTFFCALEA